MFLMRLYVSHYFTMLSFVAHVVPLLMDSWYLRIPYLNDCDCSQLQPTPITELTDLYVEFTRAWQDHHGGAPCQHTLAVRTSRAALCHDLRTSQQAEGTYYALTCKLLRVLTISTNVNWN